MSKNLSSYGTPYKRPPSPKMLKHLRKVAKLLHARALERRKAKDAAKAKKTASRKAKKPAPVAS